MATNVRSNSLKYRHDNYSTVAAASVATKTPVEPADYLLISNVDAANDAKLSFDGGTTYITLHHGLALELFPCRMISYMVKDAVDASHATIECLYGSEE
jgi:hypothetical protein